jgi:ABC-type lipoprotein export system ATPase subunit
VLDEPTSRLDRTGAAAVAELLTTAAEEDHQTVICATHDPALLRRATATVELG